MTKKYFITPDEIVSQVSTLKSRQM